ncbi:ParB/RepB/Spo0J family partition protein [Frigoriglobus tundricola]|uniref:ParB/Spo0J HTH domain-containing protein n=1 Tax=Frigoriglobus tundricola TaxID=2774151 RepID=A0A6M5YLJ8_9BACT|nr:ParB N-terminal domain-containing protein [Frigoriglobus tundricola]QJW94186.1 hypothetical protein FTUN_1705 [Frigoriglobus tundricola]
MAALRLHTVPLTACDIAFNPRSARDPDYCRSLGENIRMNGQQVPLIGFYQVERFQVADGGCRVVGMQLAGLTEALALDLGKQPTAAELLMAQASVDLYKEFLPPLDRAQLYRSLLDARGCTAVQLAHDLCVSDSTVGKYLSLLTLPANLQQQINAGTLEFSKACVLAQEPDPVRQLELAMAAPNLSRTALARLAMKGRRAKATSEKFSKVRCQLVNGTIVTVSGAGLDWEGLIDAISAALDYARKAHRDSLDIKTAEKVWKERASGKKV